MRLVEEAGPVQEIAQPRAFEAVSSPRDLGRRTAPGLALENRPVTFRKFAVEARVVGNDDHGLFRKGGDRRFVDALSRDYLVRNAGQRRDLQGDWLGRLVER
jgi:hypothetical protein